MFGGSGSLAKEIYVLKTSAQAELNSFLGDCL